MPELDDETLATWRAFLNAHARVTRAIGRDLAAAGLPDLSWYDLLWALYRQPGRSLRVNELAREVVLSPTAMSRFVDRVEEAGCVRREPDPDDRRAAARPMPPPPPVMMMILPWKEVLMTPRYMHVHLLQVQLTVR